MKYIFNIFYKTANDFLPKAVNSVMDGININIINNNFEPIDVKLDRKVDIITPIYPLNYCQTFNLSRKSAIVQDLDVLFTMHDDAEFKSKEQCELFFDFVKETFESGKKWGQILSKVPDDIITAYNVKAMKEVGEMDLVLQQYFVDFDYYRRLQLAGFPLVISEFEFIHNGGGSTSIKRDEHFKQTQNYSFPLYEQYYISKWGGKIRQEKYVVPFNLER